MRLRIKLHGYQMNYNQSLNYIENLGKSKIKLGLENITKILSYLNNPQSNYKSIHVAGTNGKGSVCLMIERILSQADYKVGLYSSPHLVSITERIKIGENEISKKDFAKYMTEIADLIEKTGIRLTYFEIITVMCFKYFNDKNVEFAVIETGLGGRLDATNVLEDKVCVITNVSFDHEHILGNTLLDIAKEKFGIIKKNNVVITGIEDEALLSELKKVCKEKNAKISPPDKGDLGGSILTGYQLKNAQIAIKTIMSNVECRMSDDLIKNALSNFSFPGRMQKINYKQKQIILDGAHNLAGILELEKSLKKDKRKKLLIFGVLKDKNYKQMTDYLFKYFDKVVFTSDFYQQRSLDVENPLNPPSQGDFSKIKIIKKMSDVIKYLDKVSYEVIYVTGSLYLVGEFLKRVK